MATLIQTHRRCGGPVRPEARGILLESATMTTTLKIDFVSDISCPWCAVGLGALEQALDTLKGEVSAELHFQPFELNPQMPPGGQRVLRAYDRFFLLDDLHRPRFLVPGIGS